MENKDRVNITIKRKNWKKMAKLKIDKDFKSFDEVIESFIGCKNIENIAGLLYTADLLYINTQDEKLDDVQPFFSILKTIYLNFRPLIREDKKLWFENKIVEIKGLIKDWKSSPTLKNKVPITIIYEEEKLYSELLEIKQVIGLGFKFPNDKGLDFKFSNDK